MKNNNGKMEQNKTEQNRKMEHDGTERTQKSEEWNSYLR